MRKFFCLILAVTMVFSMAAVFTACGGNDGGADVSGDANGDGNGFEIPNPIIAGVTRFEPMNYLDASGNWTGFDTEFAQEVAKRLGTEVEFQEIVWANKFLELDSGAITVIWNGFTANSYEGDTGIPRSDFSDMSYAYLTNQQSLVVRAERVSEFTSRDDVVGKTLAAESGSAGETQARRFVGEDGSVIGVPAQIDTFIEVASGAVDAAVIDILLANRLADSPDFAGLAVANFVLNNEVYAIGFRKGDPLRLEINRVMREMYEDGTLMAIAERYGLEDKLILEEEIRPIL